MAVPFRRTTCYLVSGVTYIYSLAFRLKYVVNCDLRHTYFNAIYDCSVLVARKKIFAVLKAAKKYMLSER